MTGEQNNERNNYFWHGSSGLFLARELGNKSILHFIGRKDDIGMSSKYGNKYIAGLPKRLVVSYGAL